MIATSNDGAEGESGGSGGGGGGGGNGGAIQLKKGPWTAAEDAILVEYVRKHGEGNWNAVQRNSGLARCGKSCRLRWANHLRPNLKKGAFSPEEERLIVELHAKYGNKWARMAGLLPGRTDNEIKNYWNTRVKRHQRQGIPLYPPDIQPQHHRSPRHYHHDHQHQYHHHSTPTTPTTPTSQSTFILRAHQLPSPTTPAPTHSITHASPTHPLSIRSCPSTHSACTTPTSSFTFQPHHQLASPTTSQAVSHATTPLLSPLSSPYTVNTTSISGGPPCHTLPLLDFSFPRPTPILQAPMRFKRFSSSSSSSATANDDNCIASNNASSTHFSLPLSPVSSCNTTPLGHQMPRGSFTGLLSSSSTNSEFLSELQRENQKMCELFAAVTQPELPSNQLLSPSSRNANSGITIPALNATACNFGRSLTMNANSNDSENDGNGRTSALKRPSSGSLEGLELEARALVESGRGTMEPSHLVLQEQGNNPVEFDGFGGDWDDTNSLPISLGLETKVESGSDLDRMAEDLTALVNCLPSSMQGELYMDNGDISNDPSSVVTDDNLGFDMQQIASLFPTNDNTRNLGSFSGYNLPRGC